MLSERIKHMFNNLCLRFNRFHNLGLKGMRFYAIFEMFLGKVPRISVGTLDTDVDEPYEEETH